MSMTARNLAALRLCACGSLAAVWLGAPVGVIAQDTEDGAMPGVELGLVYETTYVPPIAVMPIRSLPGDEGAAQEIHGIVASDLRYSGRFAVIDSLPVLGQGVDYSLWDGLGADWLVAGTLENTGTGGSVLEVELHDIVFSTLRDRQRFPVPRPSDPGFRMAVHQSSDAVVEWVTGEPGIAATRIAFAMRPWGDPEGTSKELYVVDSDGENVTRLTWDQNTVVSPAWSPDGNRIAYTSWKSGIPTIYELELGSGEERALDPGREGQQITPAYHPNGRTISFALMRGRRSDLFSFDMHDACCLSGPLGGGYYKNLQPTYSGDGSQIAFTSNRLGTPTPQIYVMPTEGGEPRLISPYRYGDRGYFTDPDWSPISGKVAFAGRIETRRNQVGARMRYHILVADTETNDNRLIQLTREGNNEDPSWAPNGRHIVFTGERSYGHGVFVVDSGTGRTRILVASVRAEDVDWSPPLGPAGGNRAAGAGVQPANRQR